MTKERRIQCLSHRHRKFKVFGSEMRVTKRGKYEALVTNLGNSAGFHLKLKADLNIKLLTDKGRNIYN